MRALGIFVEAPIPGRVKLRLADDIGPSGAAEVSGRLGRQVVAATVASGQRTTVWFTPAAEAAFVREWLEGAGRVRLRPQVGASLGERLTHVFAREFADGGRRVVIIGTDCPGVDRRLVAEAFTALAGYDVVLGPASDGGCYLVGLTAPRAALFRGVAGPASAVSQRTLVQARALGLSCRVLRPLRAVVTAGDARVLGLLRHLGL